MSGLVVGLVIELPISEVFTSEMKFTAVIYADHAWQDGTHAHPAIATVAAKTGYHERSVQRYVRSLEALGLLILDGKGPKGTNQYKFPLVMADGSARLNVKLKGGDTLPPRQPATGDRDSGDTDSGDTSVTRTNQPSLNQEEEEKGAAKFSFSANLQIELEDAQIFRSIWPEVERLIQVSGWSEADVVALLDWQIQINKAKPERCAQRIVARLREGTKAPQGYYKFNQRRLSGKWYPGRSEETEMPAESEEQIIFDDIPTQIVADETVTVTITGYINCEQAWQSVLGQLQMEMPRASFDSWVRDSRPLHFENQVLEIGTRNADARDWLESRLKSTVERLLIGILNMRVDVEFVVAQPFAVETEAYASE